MQARAAAFVFMKPLGVSKTRLSEVLACEQRESLAAALLSATLDAALACDGLSRVTVVGGDETVREICGAAGAIWHAEPASGLNQSLQAMLPQAGNEGFLYLPADLPCLEAQDLDAMLAEAGPGRLVIAPDGRREGTNALLIPPGAGFVPSLGPSSFQRHLCEAERLGLTARIVDRPGLAFDVDTPGDLSELLSRDARRLDRASRFTGRPSTAREARSNT
jgi:2-phospho-L-lactate guanylyltransferase